MDRNIFTPAQQKQIAKALQEFHGIYSWDDMPTSTLGVRAVAELLEFAVDPQSEREEADLNVLALNSRHLRSLVEHLFTPDVEAIVKQMEQDAQRLRKERAA